MIGERTNDNFILLHFSNTLAEARNRLNEKQGLEAVIFDDDERPVTVITAGDLLTIDETDDRELGEFAGQLPPGVILQATASIEEFANSPEFTAFGAGARGVIVLDEGQLVGVLTHATITDYLREEFELLGELKGFPSDIRLPGTIEEKPIVIYCDEFNHRNELTYYNRRKPPQCQNKKPYPHPIRK